MPLPRDYGSIWRSHPYIVWDGFAEQPQLAESRFGTWGQIERGHIAHLLPRYRPRSPMSVLPLNIPKLRCAVSLKMCPSFVLCPEKLSWSSLGSIPIREKCDGIYVRQSLEIAL